MVAGTVLDNMRSILNAISPKARLGESLRIGMLSSPSTSGKTYEDPCPIQTRRDKRIVLCLVWVPGHGSHTSLPPFRARKKEIWETWTGGTGKRVRKQVQYSLAVGS